MSSLFAHIRRVLVFPSFIALASGCALLDPHILPEQHAPLGDEFHGTLPAAINRAGALRQRYFQAVREHSIVRSSVGLSLIPLSASALYLGFASDANAGLASGLGLGAAGLYGIGNHLESSPRQKAYLNGAQAVTCAVLAMTPLLYPSEQYDSLKNAVSAISTHRTDVRSQIPILEELLDEPFVDEELRTEARTRINHAESVLKNVVPIEVSGNALIRRIDSAGTSLNGVIDEIAIATSREVLKTEPTLASVMGAVGNLGFWAGKFGSVPTLEPAMKEIVVDDDDGDRNESGEGFGKRDVQEFINQINDKTQELVVAASTVSLSVASVEQLSETARAIEMCTVEEIEVGFRVFPEGEEFDLQVGESISFSVADDTGIPIVQLLGRHDAEVSLEAEAHAGFLRITVSAGPKATAGQHFLQVASANGSDDVRITVSIKTNEKEKGNEENGNTTCDDEDAWKNFLRSEEQALFDSRSDVKAFQKNLLTATAETMNSGIDGCIGKETRELLKKYKMDNKDKLNLDDQNVHDDTVDQPIIDALGKTTPS